MPAVQPGQVLNPMGNPNIGQIAKEKSTGPRSVRGKLKAAISSGALVSGKQSKLMKFVDSCKTCPLGPREETRTVNGKDITVKVPAQCKAYENKRKKCIYTMQEQINKMRVMFEIEETEGTVGLQKALIAQSIADGEMARKAEILTHGYPKFYTKEFTEQASKYTNELNKMQHSSVQQHQHLHVGEDTAKKMVDAMFEEVEDEKEPKGEQGNSGNS